MQPRLAGRCSELQGQELGSPWGSRRMGTLQPSTQRFLPCVAITALSHQICVAVRAADSASHAEL